MTSTADLLDMRGIGQRSTGYRFELLDNADRVIGDLHPNAMDLTPVIRFDSSRFSTRDMTNFNLIPAERGDVNTLTDRVRAWMLLENGVECSLGIFLFADEAAPHHSYGIGLTSNLTDKGLILDQGLEKTIVVATSRAVRDAIVNLITDTGVDAIVDSPSADADTIAQPMIWPGGTPRSQVLTDLCAQSGLNPPWFDRNGVCRVERIKDPDVADVTVAFEPGLNIEAETIVHTNDLLTAFNRTIAISSDSQNQAFIGIYDVPAGQPHSFEARGFRVVQVVNVEGIGSQKQIIEAARSIGRNGGRGGKIFVEHVTLSGMPDGRHDGYDIIDYDGHHWLEETWTLPLNSFGPMVHTMHRSAFGG